MERFKVHNSANLCDCKRRLCFFKTVIDMVQNEERVDMTRQQPPEGVWQRNVPEPSPTHWCKFPTRSLQLAARGVACLGTKHLVLKNNICLASPLAIYLFQGRLFLKNLKLCIKIGHLRGISPHMGLCQWQTDMWQPHRAPYYVTFTNLLCF